MRFHGIDRYLWRRRPFGPAGEGFLDLFSKTRIQLARDIQMGALSAKVIAVKRLRVFRSVTLQVAFRRQCSPVWAVREHSLQKTLTRQLVWFRFGHRQLTCKIGFQS